MEAEMLLRDSDIYPSDKVLQEALGETVYEVLVLFLKTITDEDLGLSIEWRYYKDGKAWLGKVVNKKKTILWLSVWDGFFKTSFFFMERNLEAIAALDISETIKDDFAASKSVGKLIPMLLEIKEEEQLNDLLAVVCFKKSLK